MDSIPKQVFRVRDLPTRSVTLFPTRAHVTRDIKHVALEPGLSQIVVSGLTPTVDEHSVKVEGTGSALISDIAVELLPNRDIFEEIYPESDDDESGEEESDDGEDGGPKAGPELAEIRAKLIALRDEHKIAREVIASAESRLKILDGYGKAMLNPKQPARVDVAMENYRIEREKVFQDHMQGSRTERTISHSITDAVKEENRLLRLQAKEWQKANKARAKSQKARDKERQKKQRREAEKHREKQRVRQERERYWPRSCYTVRITLDASDFKTPTSSRRSSVASAVEVLKPSPEGTAAGEEASLTCDLAISYVTSSAFWAPSYDLQLSTTSSAATLCFDARLTNTTSESWDNCRVSLSTSQTTYSGLSDAIPTLVPWHIKLAHKDSGLPANALIASREEEMHKNNWQAGQRMQPQRPRAELFGKQPAWRSDPQAFPQAIPPPAMPAGIMQQMQKRGRHLDSSKGVSLNMAAASGAAQSSALFGGPAQRGFGAMAGAAGGGLFGRVSTSHQTQPSSGGLYGSTVVAEHAEASEEGSDEGDDGLGATISEPEPELEFQDSLFEETGLTTSYDLPGLKSLSPSSTASKQRVARISFTNVVFSHTVVAKYKPAAYLKAKLRNTSKLTLLKGPVGLTLDGSFMGRSTLPRCSAGESFTMSLGVDPAITVAYPKPEVKRSTTGLFNKEDSSVYKRTISLGNTRAAAGRLVSLLVLDQVPVSEDEKLRVEVLHPHGLAVGGAAVVTGAPGNEGGIAGKEDADWGKATATLKKGGEAAWDVSLKAGRSVKLSLEYEVAAPAGDRVAQC